ncbi:hypothetical protein B0I73DRAFT_100745 [Yarrowia lipolytica]|nr:hypothetical protein B0I73DRAFT_100745 [Yarrowia lipolytica]
MTGPRTTHNLHINPLSGQYVCLHHYMALCWGLACVGDSQICQSTQVHMLASLYERMSMCLSRPHSTFHNLNLALSAALSNQQCGHLSLHKQQRIYSLGVAFRAPPKKTAPFFSLSNTCTIPKMNKFATLAALVVVFFALFTQAAVIEKRLLGHKIDPKYPLKFDIFSNSNHCNGARIKSITIKTGAAEKCYKTERFNSVYVAPSNDCEIRVFKDHKCRGDPDYILETQGGNATCFSDTKNARSVMAVCQE